MTEVPVPTGYRSTEAPGSGAHVWRPPLYFSVLLLSTLLVTAHEVLWRQAQAFARSPEAGWSSLSILVGCIAFGLGGSIAYRFRQRAQQLFAPLLLLDAICIAASAALNMVAFANDQQAWSAPLIQSCCGALLGATLLLSQRAISNWWRQLPLFYYLLRPHALLLSLLLLTVATSVAAMLGMLRSALVAGILLALLAWWYRQLCQYLEPTEPGPPKGLARASAGCVLLMAFAFIASELWVSREQHGFFQSPIVFAAHRPRSEVVISSGPSGMQLFENRSLRYADIDGHRYFEALVHPALALKPRAARVLLLGSADGFAANEVLKHQNVERLVLVTHDLFTSRLAQDVGWLKRRTNAALSSPKVRLIEEEPIVWLEQSGQRFDVAIVDMPDPTAPRWGKNFTRYFYRALGRRLSAGGIAAIQAGPTFGATLAYATVKSSIQSASLTALGYQVALPSIGDWGFFLVAREPLAAPNALRITNTRYLDSNALAVMFAMPKDSLAKPAKPNTLQHQRIVGLFNNERGTPE